MTDSLRDRQAQEPRCYNCGSHGHWAVACPEPTRKTPAGLAAWRSASAGNVKNQSYNSGSKRSKGPIITKYSPPSFASNMGSYPPPPTPPGAHPPSGLYLAHSFPPAFPSGYAQPVLPYHSSPQFAPPATYGLPHYGQPSHLGLPSPLPGHLATSCANLDHRSPRPPFHASFPHSSPSQKLSQVKASPASARQSALPSSIATPATTRLSHPLPPKPPPSHDHFKSQRDHRSKRKIDRPHSQEKGVKSARSGDLEALAADDFLPADRRLPGNSPASGRHDEGNVDAYRPCQSPEKRVDACEANGVRATSVTKTDAKKDGDVISKCIENLESVTTGKEVSPRPVDEADRSIGREQSLSSHSNETGDTAVESVGFDNAVSYTVEASDDHEDGEISSNEDVLSLAPHDAAAVDDKSNSRPVEDHWRPKRRYSDEWDDDTSYAKRLKPRGASRTDDNVDADGDADGDIWDSLDVPRQADRKRRGSAGSRHSSVSSKSSDLNSLEAELLGRPVKHRQVEEATPRPQSRSERRAVSKPKKRRQNNTNSAYSRRW
ncbi:hypothetical protein CP533_1228 [Ophiocordyceps camponoti-saundersi (nom. inval.)]|nr:hypothetical protein CP533_1228 [Ophiocordyceps camponoti-saundersi (nom. inval.)]